MSNLTRVPGLVSIADVARTALKTPHPLHWQKDGGAVATSYRLEQQIEIARSTTMPGSVLVMSLLVFFALLFPRGAPTAFGTAIGVNLVQAWFRPGPGDARAPPPARSPAAGSDRDSSATADLVLGVGLVALVLVRTPRRCSSARRPCRLVDLLELTSGSFGVSNLLETWLLHPALLGAALRSAASARSACTRPSAWVRVHR